MKTKIFSAALVLIMALGFTQTFAQKAAVISLYANKEIGASEFGNLVTALQKLADSDDFRLDNHVETLHKKLFDEYAGSLGYEFMPEEEVLNTPGYDESLLDGVMINASGWTVRPEGYVAIRKGNKKSVKKAFEIFNKKGCDYVVIMAVDYNLVKAGIQVMGFGNAKVQANMRLFVLDAKGKKVFKATKTAKSDGSMKFALGGIFDAKEIQPLVDDATAKTLALLDAQILKKKSKGK